MSAERRAPFLFGARTIKTGIAVTISLFLSQYVPYSLPLLAGVAAVICMHHRVIFDLEEITGDLTSMAMAAAKAAAKNEKGKEKQHKK